MRTPLFFLLVLVGLVTACANPTAVPSAPTPASTGIPTFERTEKTPVVQLTIAPVTDAHPGTQATLVIHAEPMLLETGFTPSGAAFTSLSKWDNAGITQMRLCMEIKKPCVPDGDWSEFQSEWQTEVDVDWMGERTYWLGAQFRDRNGQNIGAYNPSNPPAQRGSGATQIIINSTMDERTPISSQPAFAQTAVAATRLAYPVTGTLVLQNGLCCAGGKVGTTIEIHAAFEATSPNTRVTQMRLLNHCGSQSEMNTAPWEPFVPQKTFPYPITAANWVGWYLAVQYRDANGNLSPIYCEDISIEGMSQ